MKRTIILAVVLLITSFQLLTAKNEISVAKFGAIPNDNQNDAEALRQAAAYCRTHRGTTLVFPAGIYNFRDETAAEIERKAISGELGKSLEVQFALFQPRKPYVVGLNFMGSKDLTIKAAGAILNVEGWMEVLSFVKTQNVLLDGLTITYKRPAATEATVVASGPNSYDMTYDPDVYKYIDKNVTGRYGWFYSVQRHCFYDGDGSLRKSEVIHPGLIHVESNLNPPVGDVCIIRYGGHYRPCIMLKESDNITVHNVTIHSFAGMGIVGHLTHNIMIDGLKIVPEVGRYSSTNTDATHFTSCSGTLTIQNSVFKGNGDDCTNIHNYYYHFYPQKNNARKVEIKVEQADLHAQSLDYPTRGDTMIVLNCDNFEEEGRYIVKDVDTSTVNWQVMVTFDRPINVSDPKGFRLINHTRFPKVRILNNTIYYHYARGFLLKVPNAIVRGNSFESTAMTAVKLGAELSWNEGGPVENILIENNYVNDTGDLGGPSFVLASTEARSTPPRVNKNIIIRNNVINSKHKDVIRLIDSENVLIENNQVNQTDYVQLEHCNNVKIMDYPKNN